MHDRAVGVQVLCAVHDVAKEYIIYTCVCDKLFITVLWQPKH